MTFFRYLLMSLLVFCCFSSSQVAFAGKDPIGWRVFGNIPPITAKGALYGPITYTFINNLPFRLTCPLYITPAISPNNGEFINYVDHCSGKSLMPGETCTVSFSFQSLTPGVKSITLYEQYGRDIVPLPPLVTTTAPSEPLIGTVTIPLPPTIGAGEYPWPFEFTYTNNTGGIITGLVSPNPTRSPAAANSSINSISNQCALLTELNPGQSCTVSGNFQAGVVSPYTVSHTLSYFAGSTTLATSTNAIQRVVGAAPTFPDNFGPGEQRTLDFVFTNTGTKTVTGVGASTLTNLVTGSGGSASISSDGCGTLVGNELPAGGTCHVLVDFQAGTDAPSPYTATVTFNGNGGAVSATTPPFTPTQQITGTAPTFPANFGPGELITLTYTFTNNGSNTATGIVPSTVTGIAAGAGGSAIITSDTCASAGSLNAGDDCFVQVDFQAGTIAAYTATVNFNFTGGTVSATTPPFTPTQQIQGTPATFPANFGPGELITLTYTFTNAGSNTATGIGASTLTGISTGIGGSAVISLDTCQSAGQLNAGASCTVQVDFQAGTIDSYTATVNFNFTGGTVSATTTPPFTPTQQITGTAPTFPSNFGPGELITLTYTFTNNGSNTATGIGASTLTGISTGIGGSAVISLDTCQSAGQLNAGASCTVQVDFQAGTIDAYTATVNFNFTGGTVSATTPAFTPTQQMVGTASFPSDMGTGERVTLIFTFTNNGSNTATGFGVATLTGVVNGGGSPMPAPSIVANGCQSAGQVVAGGSCTVTVDFQAGTNTPSPYTATVNQTFNGGTVSATTTPVVLPPQSISGAVTGFPANPGAGEQYNLTFTFTNTRTSGPVRGITGVAVVPAPGAGGTISNVVDNCALLVGGELPATANCTVTALYSTTTPVASPYQAIATLTYYGGTPSVSTTSGNATITIVPSITTGLPNAVTLLTPYPVVFNYLNNDTGTAYGINITPPNYSSTGGTCIPVAPPGACIASTLGPGANCTLNCTFIPTSAGPVSVTITFTYAGGTSVLSQTTSSTASFMIVGSVTPMPSIVPVHDGQNPAPETDVTFIFKNTGKTTAKGPFSVTPPNPSPNRFHVTKNTCSSVSNLKPGDACLLTGKFTGLVTGETKLTATLKYGQKGSSSLPVTVKTNVGRVITLHNRCKEDVWFAFNGGIAQYGCNNRPASCPDGSVCHQAGNGGAGICYWANPLPISRELRLAPMLGNIPTTSAVLVPDRGAVLGTLWQGSVAGRTGCSGASCQTADCNSGGGNNACPAGAKFNLPATSAELKLKKNGMDHYSLQGSYGLNLSLSIGPTGTPYGGDTNPYFCATPGDAGLGTKKSFSACSWKFTAPASPGFKGDQAGDYFHVLKNSTDKACMTAADCTAEEVCGLRYDASVSPSFKRVCGKQMGYWTAAQACLLNPVDAHPYFNCNAAIENTAYVLGDLYTCSSAMGDCYHPGASANCCGCIDWNTVLTTVPLNGTTQCMNTNPNWKTSVYASDEAKSTITWLKKGCPQLMTYPHDLGSTQFMCETKDKGTPTKDTNVTNYTITFCPEVSSNTLSKKNSLKLDTLTSKRNAHV